MTVTGDDGEVVLRASAPDSHADYLALLLDGPPPARPRGS
jgi:hypothetical protein